MVTKWHRNGVDLDMILWGKSSPIALQSRAAGAAGVSLLNTGAHAYFLIQIDGATE